MEIKKMICASEDMWNVLKVWSTIGGPAKVAIIANIFGEETVLSELLKKKGCDVSFICFGGNIIDQTIEQVGKRVLNEIVEGTLVCCNAERKVVELGLARAFRASDKKDIAMAFLEEEVRRMPLAKTLFCSNPLRIMERVCLEEGNGKTRWLPVDATRLEFEDYCIARGCSINAFDMREMDEVTATHVDCYEYFGGVKTATDWASGLLAFLIEWHKKNKKAFSFFTMQVDKKMIFVVMNRKTGKPWWIIPHFQSVVEVRDWREDEILFIPSDDLRLECNLSKRHIIAFSMDCNDVDASFSNFSNLLERLS